MELLIILKSLHGSGSSKRHTTGYHKRVDLRIVQASTHLRSFWVNVSLLFRYFPARNTVDKNVIESPIQTIEHFEMFSDGSESYEDEWKCRILSSCHIKKRKRYDGLERVSREIETSQTFTFRGISLRFLKQIESMNIDP